MKDLAIDDHFVSLDKTPMSAKIQDSSPCFNIDFIRLGSAPPYRKSNLLPELSNVTPRSVRLQEKKLERKKSSLSYNDVKDGDKDKNTTSNKKHHITKSNSRRLNHLGKPDMDSKFNKDNNNNTKNSVLKERTGHHSTEHVLTPRRVSKAVLARQSFNSRDALLICKNEQRCSGAYDKLKIAGIAITKSKMLPNGQKSEKSGTYPNEFPKTVEKQKSNSILKYPSRPDFYYRKRNSNLSNNQNTRTLNYVGHTIKRAELFHRGCHKFENDTEVNTLDEYCRLEDQRYYIEAQNIKKFLFQRWLSNIEGHLDELQTTGSSSSETNKSSSELNEEDEYHLGSS